MNLRIGYSKQAEKFLQKHYHLLTKEDCNTLLAKAMKKMLHFEAINVDVKPLKGYNDRTYRIRTGSIRIIFSYLHDEIVVVSVQTIDFRGNVYE